MRTLLLLAVALASVLSSPASSAATEGRGAKTRIAIVSSYHREYLWSQDTNRGVVAALLEHGYLDDPSQVEAFTRDDAVESSTAILVKLWMDTKRRNGRLQIARSLARVVAELDAFAPDILLLGDDNAVNHVGNQYVDTDLDVVFWGVDGSPLRYDLIDSMERPGHNVTGVYQKGYIRAGIESLLELFPLVRRVAVLSDASATARPKLKELKRLARRGELPVELVASVVTDSYEAWQEGVESLADEVDAFVVLNHNTLKRESGDVVDPLEAAGWYLRHSAKPEVSPERQYVVEGMLAAVDDSGYKQGYEAVEIAHRILAGGERPASIPVRAPSRGAFVVNLERAAMLGVEARVASDPRVGERVDTALALRDFR